MPQGFSFLVCLHCFIISVHALKMVQHREVSGNAYMIHASPDAYTSAMHNISTKKVIPSGFGKLYGESLAYKGKIYASPHNFPDLMILDTVTEEISLVSTQGLRQPEVGKNDSCKDMPYWFGITAYKDKIYASPGCTGHILIYDIASKQISGIPTSSVDTVMAGWLGMAECNGKLYAAPAMSDKLLVYDPATSAVTGVDTSSVCTSKITKGIKFMGMACWEGKVYAAPVEADGQDKYGKVGTCDELLIYDTVKEKVSSVSTKEIGPGKWKWHGMTVLNGVVYAVPSNVDNILIYDTKTEKISGVSTKALGGARTHMWSGLTTDGHKIYGAPQRNHQILAYDPETQVVTGLDAHALEGKIAEDNAAWNGIAYWDGKLYCSAYNNDAVLVYDLNATGVSN